MILTGNRTERDKGNLWCGGFCKRSRCFHTLMDKYLSAAFGRRQALAAAASRILGGLTPCTGCSFPVCAKNCRGEACTQAICPAVVRATATGKRDSTTAVLVLVDYWRQSDVSDCSRTHPCSEKLMTINKNYPELLG